MLTLLSGSAQFWNRRFGELFYHGNFGTDIQLETVTSIPAKAFCLSKNLGTLEPGKLADLILVDGDPLANIDDAAKVRCVMKNGILMSVESIAKPFVQLPASAACPAN